VSPRDKFPSAPILCYVTDRKSLSSGAAADNRALLQRIKNACAAGIDWIQIREKDLSGKECSSLVLEARMETRTSPQLGKRTKIIVNDRLDVALAERADGVHLGEDSLPVKNVCAWLRSHSPAFAGEDFLIGVSCHSKEQAKSAERDGADYIFFGPIFATPSKMAFGPPQGLERLAQVCGFVSIPVIAIGGITRENASACVSAGAAGVAAIRLFQHSDDLPRLVADLRDSLR
jgi:thiamine-phosphate pyrophosphorylase